MKPEKVFRAGSISASIWKNKSKDGEYRTVSFERTYKDKNGQWQKTTSMRINDLPKAGVVIGAAYEFLVLDNENNEEIVV